MIILHLNSVSCFLRMSGRVGRTRGFGNYGQTGSVQNSHFFNTCVLDEWSLRSENSP